MENKKQKTELQAVPEKPVTEMTSRDLVQSKYMFEQVAKALPNILTPERFMRVTLTSFNKNPKLAECTNASIASCVLQSAQVGLEPDGRHAHLIPYKNWKTNQMECQLQIDYKGLVALVRRSGEVSTIHTDIVHENDVFEYNLGVVTVHRIDWKEDRGEPYAVYAMATLKDGSTQCAVMSKAEIDAIKDRSNSVKSAKAFGGTTPWDTDWGEMAKKTVFRRLTKMLPLSYEAISAIELENKDFQVTHEREQPVNIPKSTSEMNNLIKKSKTKKPEIVIEVNEPEVQNSNDSELTNEDL